MLFLDVDRFKLVNDSLGHEVGDRLLIEVADRLRSSLRPGDTVARFGGDEFTILLTGLYEPDAAVRVAERILDQLRAPVAVGSRELFITSSIGIVFTSDPEDAGDLLREADLAMYLAKEKGRARWELFDKKSAPAVVERLELEGDLWRAVDEGELVVHFQPEVSLEGGEVVAVEALVRWNHPERGMLLPASFIPFAEESSLILAVDRFVLRRSCLQAKEWQSRADAPPLRVSINLSPRFVRQMDAGDDIMSIVPRDRCRPPQHPAGDHRTHRARRRAADGRNPQRAARARHQGGDRRLRHRLLVAQLPEALPDRHAQARQVLRGRHLQSSKPTPRSSRP